MMKHLKKVLALVIVLTMSLSVVVSAGTAFPDVADDATYAEAAQILKSLNIMIGDENGNFNPDKVVTRAEMAKILCVITGKGDDLAPVDSGFADATSAHWASGYIAAAKNAGYINGMSATEFWPDSTVKWEQAVKLLMAALKYDQMAADNGGYPEGWIYAAGEAEVTGAGAAGAIGEDCTRAKIAMLVYYAIDADMMKQTVYSKDKEWVVAKGETLLNKYMDIYKVEGKVVNSYKLDNSLDSGYVNFTITKTNDIDVEKELDAVAQYDGGKLTGYALTDIDATGTAAADLLAYSSVAYIHKDDDDELSIAAIAAKGKKNKITEITDMDLVYDATKDYNERASRLPNFEDPDNYRFSYWNDRDADNSISYVKVDANVLVVINNEAPKSISEIASEVGDNTDDILAAIVPVRGKISLVDTDNDGYIDLYEAKNYEVAVVDSVNADRLRINFKTEKTFRKGYISLDEDVNTNLKEYTITLDGKEIGIADLAEYDVLTISTNDFDDPRYFDIVVSRDKVEGKVTAVKEKDEKIFVGGEEYELVTGMNGVEFSDVAINDEGVFYLDADGYIAYFDTKVSVSDQYAYLDRIAVDGMGTVTMRMFTYEGVKLTTDVADKVKINGQRVTVADAPESAKLTAMFGAQGAALATKASYIDVIKAIISDEATFIDDDLDPFVTFKISGNELTELNFAYRTASDDKDFTYVTKATNVEWQADFNKFKSSKTLADNAKIFVIDGTAIDDWKVIEPKNLVNENEYSPYFFAYQNDGTMGAAVVFESSTNINENGSLAFFKDYRSGVYGDDEKDVYYVTYWTEGKLAAETIAVDADALDTVVEGMEIGDAFLFGKNSDGVVDELEVIFSPSASMQVGAEDAMDFTGLKEFMMLDGIEKLDNEVFFGVVAKTSNGKVTLLDYADAKTVGTNTEIEFDNEKIITVPSSAYVIAYDDYASDSKKLKESSASEIMASTYTKTATNGIKLTPDDDNGNGTADSIEDLSWAFVRVLNGTVTEVVTIEYFNK